MKFYNATIDVITCVLILLILISLVPTICFVTGAFAKCMVFALSLLLVFAFNNRVLN